MVGRVNAYLIEDSPLTLIDSGPNSAKALDELEQALDARGHAVEDIELLVISHQHMDHFGLASILARRSGAEVAAIEPLAALPGRLRPPDRPRRRLRRADHAAPRHPPRSRHRAARGVGGLPRLGLGGRGHATRCADGSRAASCATAPCASCTAPDTAPRTPSSSTRTARMLLAADHLIAHISSNPLLARPLGERARPRRPPPAGARHLHGLAARRRGRWTSSSCCPATARRSPTTSR